MIWSYDQVLYLWHTYYIVVFMNLTWYSFELFQCNSWDHFFKYILWQPRIKEVKRKSKGVLDGYTLPIFEIDDGSEAHWILASVTFLLLRVTLTKFLGSLLLETSVDFFPMEVLSLLDFSGSSTVPLALTFFVGAWILCCSLEGFVGACGVWLKNHKWHKWEDFKRCCHNWILLL